jgi:hypothetical protein
MSGARCLTCGRVFMSGTAYLHPSHRCVTVNTPPTPHNVDGDLPSPPVDCLPVGTVIPLFDRGRKKAT